MFPRTYSTLGATWKNMLIKLKTTPVNPKPPLTQKCIMHTYELWYSYIELKGMKYMNFCENRKEMEFLCKLTALRKLFSCFFYI